MKHKNSNFKTAALLFFFALTVSSSSIAQNSLPSGADEITLKGYVGQRISDCVNKRVKSQDVEHLVEPFRHKTENHRWQSEFWGKWVLGAIGSYRYAKDPKIYEMISQSAKEIISTQDDNGYIGNYAPEHQLKQWDIWGRKYTTLGLLAYYDLTGDKDALVAAKKVIDHLMTQVGDGKTDIVTTGNYHGMASSSVLEPVVYLYNHTKDKKYLDFAEYIVSRWETPDGPRLISKADEPVSKRFPHPSVWFSPENGQKAYEMMSCYEGLLELYKVIGDEKMKDAAVKTVRHIIDEEINEAGSGSAFECWYGGKEQQNFPTYHTMETCVTFTWMQICGRLLKMTGESLYADQMESTIYNALMASLKKDGSQIAKYSPLEGYRYEGEEQCGMHINCCNANGPRAFAMIPDFVYLSKDDRIDVNLYIPSKATVSIGKKKQVDIEQITSYPKTGEVDIIINPSKKAEFELALRIPAWCDSSIIRVNGESFTKGEPGKYHVIKRVWNKGDKVSLRMEIKGKVIEKNNTQAVKWGPVLLARDSRFGDGFVDEAGVVIEKAGVTELTPIGSDFAWMAFAIPMTMGTNLESGDKPKMVKFCDFSSAGDTWDHSVRYKAWIPKTLNVIRKDYVPYNQ